MPLALALQSLVVLLATALLQAAPSVAAQSNPSVPSRCTSAAPAFIENLGQWKGAARFVGRAGGVVAAVEPGGLVLQREPRGPDEEPCVVRLSFESASQEQELSGERPREARFSWFLGDDPAAWVRGARSYDAVRCAGLYRGIDLLLRADAGVLEYDLVLERGVDLARVRVAVQGADGLAIDERGALVIRTPDGPLVQPVPRTFQPLPDGGERALACRYVLLGEDRFGFEAPDHDRDLALVVDPPLLWSTYIGSGWGLGVGDKVWAVAVGPDGDVFATGEVEGGQFPVTPGAFSTAGRSGGDVFVARFRADDGALLYSSVLGGTQGGSHWQERPLAIAVDAAGRVTVGGRTDADNFPTTAGAFQTQPPASAFVFRLSSKGDDLLWSTRLGGIAWDEVVALSLAASGAVVVGGVTGSPDFPTTTGAWQTTFVGGSASFVTRLDPTGSSLEWSSLVPAVYGDVRAIGLCGTEDVVVTTWTGPASPASTPGAWSPGGHGVGVLKLNDTGSDLLWYSKFGTSQQPSTVIQDVVDVGLDAFDNPLVLGYTSAQDFPTTSGVYQPTSPGFEHGFLARLRADGSDAIYCTYLGPNRMWGLDVDPSGMATVTGSGNLLFPTTPGAYQTVPFPQADLSVARVSPAGDRLLYSTFIGGPNTDSSLAIATSPTRRATVGGFSNGGYPITPNAAFPSYIGGQTDAVLTTFDLVLEGLELHSRSSPACLGLLHANGTEMPRAGASGFAFLCSGAPPKASGALFLGHLATTPIQLSGVTLALIPSMGRIPVQSDEHGWAETPFDLGPFASGDSFAAQYVFRNPPTCLGPLPWSSSNAVLVTVQP